MKKTILSFLFSGCALALFGQPNNQNPIDAFEQQMIKKNKVKECHIVYYDVIDGNEVLKRDYDSLWYDQHGNLISIVWTFATSTHFYTEVDSYIYNDKNQITEETIFEYTDGKIEDNTRETFIYNKKGQLVKSYYFEQGTILDDSCTYKYKKDKLISGNQFDKKFTCSYTKDSMFVFYEDNKIPDCFLKGRLIRQSSSDVSYIYEYDNAGFFIRSKSYRGDIQLSESVYEYKNGLVFKVTYKKFDAKTTEVEYYSYFFYE